MYSVFAKTVINNPTKFYSIFLPLACIIRSSLHLKLSAALRRGSWGILSHPFLREPFNVSTESWDEVQASASKMVQTQKSIEFKSGDEGGYFLAPEMRKINDSCTILEFCWTCVTAHRFWVWTAFAWSVS